MEWSYIAFTLRHWYGLFIHLLSLFIIITWWWGKEIFCWFWSQHFLCVFILPSFITGRAFPFAILFLDYIWLTAPPSRINNLLSSWVHPALLLTGSFSGWDRKIGGDQIQIYIELIWLFTLNITYWHSPHVSQLTGVDLNLWFLHKWFFFYITQVLPVIFAL